MATGFTIMSGWMLEKKVGQGSTTGLFQRHQERRFKRWFCIPGNDDSQKAVSTSLKES